MGYKDDLETLGWRVSSPSRTRQAVRDFQRGWNLGRKLITDGIAGPNTKNALEKSINRFHDNKSTASHHFSYSEFACKCLLRRGVAYSDCRRIWVTRYQIRSLEEYRDKVRGPVAIVSGCRCPRYNASVGGAMSSQHMEGKASDVKGKLTVTQVMNLRKFRGIGYSSATGKVLHVDTRTPGSIRHPATWRY